MLALAEAMKRRHRYRIQFLVHGEDPSATVNFNSFGFQVAPLESDLVAEVARLTETLAPRAVVFDLHPSWVPDCLPALLSDLAGRGIRLIGIDSAASLSDQLDVTWIPSFMLESDVAELDSSAVVFGWGSFLIEKHQPSPIWSPGTKVLVTTGGTDVTRLGKRLPPLLDAELPHGTSVDWVRGPFAQAPAIPPRPMLEWTVHEAPRGLDELAVNANYALVAYGVSLFEILQYGVPCVVFSPYGGKDDDFMRELEREGVASVAYDIDAVVSKLVGLMTDDSVASAYAEASCARVQPGGPDRLAHRIESIL